jgi:hypothetical protein
MKMTITTEMDMNLNGIDAKVVTTKGGYVWLVWLGGSIEVSKVLRTYKRFKSLKEKIEMLSGEPGFFLQGLTAKLVA